MRIDDSTSALPGGAAGRTGLAGVRPDESVTNNPIRYSTTSSPPRSACCWRYWASRSSARGPLVRRHRRRSVAAARMAVGAADRLRQLGTGHHRRAIRSIPRMLTILLNEWLPANVDGVPRSQLIAELVPANARSVGGAGSATCYRCDLGRIRPSVSAASLRFVNSLQAIRRGESRLSLYPRWDSNPRYRRERAAS